jgi:thiol:disulfide interchange protein DsbD
MEEALRELITDAMAGGSAWIFLFAFVGGLLASVTPCVYPVLPLTVGYIGSRAAGSRGRAFWLSLAIVLGLALVYGVLGATLAALGLRFASLASNGWLLFGVAVFFVAMSLFLMDAFTLPTPAALGAMKGKTERFTGVAGAFVFGGVSALVIGPCSTPILAVIIGTVALTLRETTGWAHVAELLRAGVLLFLFGLGQGALVLVCGTFAGLLAKLPRAGQWMVRVKKGFGLLVLAGAMLLLVHVGQGTDFPRLTGILAALETDTSSEPVRDEGTGEPEGPTATDDGDSLYGDDPFLE